MNLVQLDWSVVGGSAPNVEVFISSRQLCTSINAWLGCERWSHDERVWSCLNSLLEQVSHAVGEILPLLISQAANLEEICKNNSLLSRKECLVIMNNLLTA